jgi:hypothetical protein
MLNDDQLPARIAEIQSGADLLGLADELARDAIAPLFAAFADQRSPQIERLREFVLVLARHAILHDIDAAYREATAAAAKG